MTTMTTTTTITTISTPAKAILNKLAMAGDAVLDVESLPGFEVGMDIVIDPDTPMMESNRIRAFGTIELSRPLLFSHQPGAKVVQSVFNTRVQDKEETDSDEIGNGQQANAIIAVASGAAATLAVLSSALFAWSRCRRSMLKETRKPEGGNIEEFVNSLAELGSWALSTGTWSQSAIRMEEGTDIETGAKCHSELPQDGSQDKPREVDDVIIDLCEI